MSEDTNHTNSSDGGPSDLAKFFPNLALGPVNPLPPQGHMLGNMRQMFSPPTNSPPPIPSRIPQHIPLDIMMKAAAQQHIQQQHIQQQQMQQQHHLQHHLQQQLQQQQLQHQLVEQMHQPQVALGVPVSNRPIPFGFPPRPPDQQPQIHAPVPTHPVSPFQVPTPLSPPPRLMVGNTSPAVVPPSTLVTSKPEQPASKSATPAKPKRSERFGVQLYGKDIVYNLDNTTTKGTKSRSQLEATPITLYNSDYIYYLGSQIAVNDNYICYAVRGFMIRVLNRSKPIRALVKGHEQPVVDLRFFSDSLDLLASSGKDGSVYIWKIVILHIQPSKSKGNFQRVCWHPQDSNIIATAGNNNNGVYIWNISKLKGENGENCVIDRDQLEDSTCEGENNALRVLVSGSEVLNISFSPDGKKVAAGCADGKVRLWHLERSDNTGALQWIAHADTRPVTAALFITEHLLVTTADYNSIMRLWDVRRQSPNSPSVDSDDSSTSISNDTNEVANTYLQSLSFTSLKDDKDNRPDNSAFNGHIGVDPSGAFLFVASTKSCVGYILHLDTASAYFDHLLEFGVTQPILSFTVATRKGSKTTQNPHEGGVVFEKLYLQLYCVQTKAIQLYEADAEQCQNLKEGQEGVSLPQEDTSHITQLGNVVPTSPVSTPSPPTDVGASLNPTTSTDAADDKPPTPSSLLQFILNSSSAPPPSPPLTMSTKMMGGDQQRDAETAETIQDHELLSTEKASEPPTFTQRVRSGLSDVTSSETPVTEIPQLPSFDAQLRDLESKRNANSSLSDETPTLLPTQPATDTEHTPKIAPNSPKPSPFACESFSAHQTSAVPIEATQGGVSSTDGSPAAEPNTTQTQPLATTNVTATTTPQPSTPQKTNAPKPRTRGERSRKENTNTPREDAPSSPQTAKQQPSSSSVQSAPPAPTRTPAPSPAATQVSILSRKKDEQQTGLQSPSFFIQNSSTNTSHLPPSQPAQPPSLSHTPPLDSSPTLAAANSAAISELVAKDMRRIENNITVLEKILQQQNTRIEKERTEREKLEKERQERLLAVISQTLNTNVQQNLERVVRKELDSILAPLIEKTVTSALESSISKPLQDVFKKSFQAFIPKVENTLNDGLNRTVDAVKDQVGSVLEGVVESAVRQPVQQVFMTYFQDMLVPSFEQSCQTMFRQIHNTFTQGIKDITPQIAAAAAAANPHPSTAGQSAATDQMRLAVQTLMDVASTMSASIVETQSKMLMAMRLGTPNPSTSYTAQYDSSLVPGVPSQNTYTAPPSNTFPPIHIQPTTSSTLPPPQPQHSTTYHPYPHPHAPTPTTLPSPFSFSIPPAPSPFPAPAATNVLAGVIETLQRLVANGRLEEAFDHALSAANLSVVVWMCENVDPRAIFAQHPIRLSQPVILSLIQQLGYDLTTSTDLKLRWLQQSILHLEPRDPAIADHVPGILLRLSGKLEENNKSFSDGSNPASSSFKIVSHIVHSLLRK